MSRIEIIDEPTFTFGSSDNPRRYPHERNLDAGERPCATHGVVVDGVPTAVVGASGGVTAAHPGSLLSVNDRHYLAVGPYVVCFEAAPFQHHWTLEIDQAACFGVYRHDLSGALLSHGELEICRFDETGRIVWASSGADIFTEGFSLLPTHIEAIDFNGEIYRFRYLDGRPYG